MEIFKKIIPYIVAVVLSIILIIVDVATSRNINNKAGNDSLNIDEFIRAQMESSAVRVNDITYYGVYDLEGKDELPEGYNLIGTIAKMQDGELTENFTSNVMPENTEVYASMKDSSRVFVKIIAETGIKYYEYEVKAN